MISIDLIGDEALVARLDAVPGRVHEGLARRTTRLGLELRRKLQSERFSGQAFRVDTGPLHTSINSGGEIGPNRIHASGCACSWRNEPKYAKALKFTIRGQTIFRRRVTHQTLPEQSFLHSALAEMAPAIEAGLREAIAEVIR